ncbi:MAG: UDP-3-O-(3-hydroxymyristoyl)glucosamine N-acyltransferase [Bradyrhizobiaceae bacterium]|nr:UDP-3-O-(3-hydroxymyristoyl)glucosamine N-acyltransferase [Bradyrhizobiaceae bacterium]
MADPFFFHAAKPMTLAEAAALAGAEIAAGDPAQAIEGVKPLDLAGPRDLSFFDSTRYAAAFRATAAGACLVRPENTGDAPKGMALLITKEPYRGYVTIARALYEAELKPRSPFGARGVDAGASVHPDARLEDGVVVDPGAVVGQGAEIGSGTVIGANAVIGAGTRIGRDCAIGPGASILHALIGDRVVIHPGVRIGQDGFGYIPGPRGMIKVPQLGRVIVQDDVEIGAGTAIDRGAGRDTMIGEGTKIDNLVQIGHNVSIGRHCIIVSHVGISGSVKIGDYVMMGGQSGVSEHVTIGDRAKIAAGAGVIKDVPAGAAMLGQPARPMREALRAMAVLNRLAEKETKGE